MYLYKFESRATTKPFLIFFRVKEKKKSYNCLWYNNNSQVYIENEWKDLQSWNFFPWITKREIKVRYRKDINLIF